MVCQSDVNTMLVRCAFSDAWTSCARSKKKKHDANHPSSCGTKCTNSSADHAPLASSKSTIPAAAAPGGGAGGYSSVVGDNSDRVSSAATFISRSVVSVHHDRRSPTTTTTTTTLPPPSTVVVDTTTNANTQSIPAAVVHPPSKECRFIL